MMFAIAGISSGWLSPFLVSGYDDHSRFLNIAFRKANMLKSQFLQDKNQREHSQVSLSGTEKSPSLGSVGLGHESTVQIMFVVLDRSPT